MLSDSRNPKAKRNETVNKSSTVVSLPGITSSMKYCKTDRKNKQSYLQTINHISENVEYGEKSTFYLSKQQTKLKQMLKKMNSDTLHMIDLIRPKKNVTKSTKEEMVMIADRQLDNSKKNISIMQIQIEKLEQKYNKIVEQQQEEQLINKIKEIKSDIESIKSGNVDMKVTIEKGGKEIVKEYSDGYDTKLTVLENDNIVFEQRLQKLKTQNSKVLEQSSRMQAKLKETEQKIKMNNDQYQKIKDIMQSETMSRNMEVAMKERKYQADAIKKKMEFQNNHLQYKYYKLLKELQGKKSTCDELSQRQEDLLKRLAKSKQELLNFESLNDRLRKQKQEKNRSVLLFLQKQRKNKETASQLKESMVSSNLFGSRQQLMPRVQSVRETNETNFNKKSQLVQTHKWQKESSEEKQIVSVGKEKEEIQIEDGLLNKQKEDFDHSTTELKQKQLQLPAKQLEKVQPEGDGNVVNIDQNIK